MARRERERRSRATSSFRRAWRYSATNVIRASYQGEQRAWSAARGTRVDGSRTTAPHRAERRADVNSQERKHIASQCPDPLRWHLSAQASRRSITHRDRSSTRGLTRHLQRRPRRPRAPRDLRALPGERLVAQSRSHPKRLPKSYPSASGHRGRPTQTRCAGATWRPCRRNPRRMPTRVRPSMT